MANVYLRTQEDLVRCGGCDCFETEEGCECRLVACNRCSKQNHIYNMYHLDKENENLWNDLSIADKLNGFFCEECFESDDEDDDEENRDDNSEDDEADY